MKIETLGIVGLGQFGTFVLERVQQLLPDIDIRTFDINGRGSHHSTYVLECDAVMFCVPPEHYVQTMQEMVPEMRPDSLILDVCTVKKVTSKALRRIAQSRPFLCTHPMFGPQSYLDQGRTLKGLDIIVCEKNMREGDYIALERFLKDALELNVTTMTADEHDKMQAIYQLLPQRIGSVVNRAGFTMEKGAIYTLSGQHFFRAMEIVKYDEQLFRQVSRLNPYWPLVWQRFLAAEAQLDLEMVEAEMAEVNMLAA